MTPDHIPHVVYGRLFERRRSLSPWGSIGELFHEWGHLRVSGFIVEFAAETAYSCWANSRGENLCLVEEGEGMVIFEGKEYAVKKGYAFKIFPDQKPLIRPQGKLIVTSIQMPSLLDNSERKGEGMEKIKIVNPEDIEEKVYEYESLGQEIITCDYFPGIGLLRFTFPIDKIPIHKHPFSDRLIRPISGKGYTYAKPEKYEMDTTTFCLFPKGAIHTNGPRPGSVYTLWAVQLPWVDSKIDMENIGGAEEFVTYVESVPPKELWKKKEDFKRAINKLKGRG